MSKDYWQQLENSAETLQTVRITDLFSNDSDRVEDYYIQWQDFYLDYSKHLIDDAALDDLIELAKEASLDKKIQAQFFGEKINITENRAVLHTALRDFSEQPIFVDYKNIKPAISQEREKMTDFVNRLHTHAWLGYTDKPITDVVNIGIGGSDLGPKMVTHALTPFHVGKQKIHFVSNVDGSQIIETLNSLNAETTLFIIASKTFTTQETLMNANTARTWFLDHSNDTTAIAKHFVACTSNIEKARNFGIETKNCFSMWDWVGGRYSLWSSIGLPIALAIGMEHFTELLKGANEMDNHFREAPFEENLPVMMALLGIWYNNFLGAQSHAILPYDHFLEYFPDYLQQADMESNGKCFDINAASLEIESGPVIWGGVGTNGQHAFHQLLHQGTKLIPVDFIIAKKAQHGLKAHHNTLIANCLAQAKALMEGKIDLECSYKNIPGNQPSSMLILEELNPRTLGSLIALYEHKIFTQSVIWNINAFDQWGVELGKKLAGPILDALEEKSLIKKSIDPSSDKLIKHLRS